jgi:hypothetical protein
MSKSFRRSGPSAARFGYERLEHRRLFSATPALNGAGVTVGQAEADYGGANYFEVNPTAVGQPASLFTYSSSAGTVTGAPPPNIAGTESWHADTVGQIFYGSGSAASGVSHVDNYEADYFVNNIIAAATPIADKVVNQSFVATDQYGNTAEDPTVDQAYDNYIARYNTIIVSSAGGAGKVASPSSSFNGISVGASDSTASQGTVDGRSKPDISAPGGVTSFTAPQVSGDAAVLVQAGQTGYGGRGTASQATDARTIKALLLDGADKQADWTHTQTMPLDPRYGAGAVNLSNSLAQLKAGQDGLVLPSFSPIGGSHSPLPAIPFLSSTHTSGWDFRTITSTSRFDGTNHYEFSVTGATGSTYTLTATLVWQRQLNQAHINNLNLYLYNTDTHKLVDQSISSVDNVQELFTAHLPAGHYELEVVKPGGTPGVTAGDVSYSETYAMAFNFVRSTNASNALAIEAIGSAATVRPPQAYVPPDTQVRWTTENSLFASQKAPKYA